MATPNTLIITGNGFNCEKETQHAFELAGSKSKIVHMNSILNKDENLSGYDMIAFIGGFSYGDHLGGGKVVANKFKYYLKDDLLQFIERDTLIIGICNGFQVMTKIGLLPGFDNDYMEHRITLRDNNSNRYEDRWVHLKANKDSKCVFTKGIDKIFVPIRHGEGKLFAPDQAFYERLASENLISFQYIDPKTEEVTEEYPLNPNGTQMGIAGINDPTGRIFGLMPHPEAYLSPYNNPYWTKLKVTGELPAEGEGLKIFKNAVEYFN